MKDITYFSLKGKHILITGSTGLIGSSTVRLLVDLNRKYSLGIKLILFVRSVEKARAFFGDLDEVEYFSQDVTKPISFDIGRIDYFILAACNAYPEAYRKTPVDVMNANYLGAYHVFEYIIKNNLVSPKVVFVSSSEVYGEYECDEHGVVETFEGVIEHFKVRSCYTESKRAAETLCLSYSSQYGLDVSIARPGYIFGPTKLTQNNRADVEFFNCAAAGNPIVLRSAGTQRRSYCYVEDAASALICILLSGRNQEAYNIALDPSKSITIAEFASLVASAAHVELIHSCLQTDAGWSPFSRALLNNEKLKSLGWQPAYSVEEGIFKTIQQMRNGIS